MSLADELLKLEQLRDSGALTEDEFQTAKRRLLDPPAPVRLPTRLLRDEDDPPGRDTSRRVSNSTILGVIGLVLFVVILSCLALQACGHLGQDRTVCVGYNCGR